MGLSLCVCVLQVDGSSISTLRSQGKSRVVATAKKSLEG